MLLVVLVTLHILFSAAWFGLGLRIAGQARRVAAGGEGVTLFAEEGTRTSFLMTVSAVLFYVFAIAAFFVGGGFAAYGPIYHASLGLGLLLVLDQAVLIQPTWSALAGHPGTPQAASDRKKLALGVGVGHLIWVVQLCLMVWAGYPTLGA